MGWCPRCGAEYVEGVRACADCGVGLTNAPPPEPPLSGEKSVVVYSTDGPEEMLGMVKDLLEGNGIRCLVTGDAMSRLLIYYQTTKYISVLEKDAPRARRLIDAYFREEGRSPRAGRPRRHTRRDG